MTGDADPVRAELMCIAVLNGETLQSIGARFGVTRERVRQIVRARGTPKLRRGWVVFDAGEFKRRTAPRVHRHRGMAGSLEAKKAAHRIHVEVFRTLHGSLGRAPDLKELGEALGVPSAHTTACIGRFWVGRGRNNRSNGITRLYRVCGFPPPRAGVAVSRRVWDGGLPVYPSSKLTREQVIEARRMAKRGMSDRTIAGMFAVSPACIWGLRTRRTYKHIPEAA